MIKLFLNNSFKHNTENFVNALPKNQW